MANFRLIKHIKCLSLAKSQSPPKSSSNKTAVQLKEYAYYGQLQCSTQFIVKIISLFNFSSTFRRPPHSSAQHPSQPLFEILFPRALNSLNTTKLCEES